MNENRTVGETCSERGHVHAADHRGKAGSFDAHALLSGPRLRRRSTVEGFWSRVDRRGPVIHEELGPCWSWTGRAYREGYGQVSWCGRDVPTHRLAYSLTHGRIESGQVVRHRCDNKRCCNPAHLEIGTIADNNRDARERGQARVDQLVRRGATNSRAKLSDERVRELRAAWRAGESIKSLADRTGLATGTLHPMLHGRTWSHVKDPATGPTEAPLAPGRLGDRLGAS